MDDFQLVFDLISTVPPLPPPQPRPNPDPTPPLPRFVFSPQPGPGLRMLYKDEASALASSDRPACSAPPPPPHRARSRPCRRAQMHKNLGVPITAKIRVFPSEEKTLQYAKCVQDAGAQVLTVHGRTRDQKGPEAPLADWGLIRKVCLRRQRARPRRAGARGVRGGCGIRTTSLALAEWVISQARRARGAGRGGAGR